MAEDTPNTESLDDQLDVGRSIDEAVGCGFVFIFSVVNAILTVLIIKRLV